MRKEKKKYKQVTDDLFSCCGRSEALLQYELDDGLVLAEGRGAEGTQRAEALREALRHFDLGPVAAGGLAGHVAAGQEGVRLEGREVVVGDLDVGVAVEAGLDADEELNVRTYLGEQEENCSFI